MDTAPSADVAVLIGRFQPFHNGHASLLKAALDAAPCVIVVLGSSFHARNSKNPFTWQERAAMIASSLSEEDRRRVSYIAVRDYYEDTRWANAVRTRVEKAAEGAQRIALIGYFKDASSDYLNHFSQWQLIAADHVPEIDATAVRRILFEAENIDISLGVIAEIVPDTIRQYLKAWHVLPHYALLAAEHRKIAADKAAWRIAPYPPVFCTVDAVVRAAGQVLLIKRGDFPGKGLWALPGGFLDQRERLLQGAIRELYEETRLAMLASTLRDALAGVAVFDHPDRSQRGRTITHAHFFDLNLEHLPEVEGSDDAAHASWVPVDALPSMEDMFFDDHFHILDHFLGLTSD